MTTIRAGSGLSAAVLVEIAAVIFAVIFASGTAAFADPPAKPAAAPKVDAKADPKAEKKTDKAAAPAPGKSDRTDKTTGDKPEKREPLSDAEAKRFVDFFDKLVAIVVANQDDCVKMAAGINGHIDANQALVSELNAPKNQNKELPPAAKERVQKKARGELTPAITKKCGTDPGVEAAFNRMGAGRG